MSEKPEEEKRGKCMKFLCRLLKWLPVFLICVSAVWAYYAFVYQYCFVLVDIIAIKVVCLIIYHVLLVLFFWSYYQTVTTPLALVPKKFVLPEDVKEELRNVLDYPGYQEATVLILNRFAIQLKTTLNNVSYEGGPRRCEKCVNQCIKPDRTHHCSICKVCILKYDHHCPWVNTCINYANYKFFVLVLLYGFLLCFFMLASTAPYFGAFWFTESLQDVNVATKAHVLCLFFVSILFGSPVSCLLGDHLYLIKLNQTTPESTRPPLFSYGSDNTAYDLGLRHNFREVFGSNAWLWFFPIFSSPGDGTEFLQKPYAASGINASSTPHSTPQSNEPSSIPMV